MAALAEGRKSGRKRRLSLKAELNRKTEVNKHAKKMKEDEMGVQVEGEDKKEVDMEENAERRDEHCKESRSSKLKQSKRKEELESELTGTVDGDGDQENELYSLLPGRHLQTKLLFTLLSMDLLPPCVCVFGSSGTGKSLTIDTVLSRLKLSYAAINCIECYSMEVLYTSVLNQLSGISPTRANNYVGYSRCESFPRFLHLFRLVIGQQNCGSTPQKPVYIVLDHAEHLREKNCLPAFVQLAELTSCNVCVILVSEIASEKLLVEPFLSIHFPQYSKAETLKILELDCPPHQPLPFFQTFVHHIWNVFSSVCRDLSELRYLSSILFPKYIEPVECGEIGRHETRRLWKHIEPVFRSLMSRVYLREISFNQLGTSLPVSPQFRLLELPFYSKYLVLASFLASHNPANTDRRIFSSLKQSRGRKHKQRARVNSQDQGPATFSLDRMMAIFYSILSEPVEPLADLYSQVSTLVSLQILAEMSMNGSLDSPRYKCRMNLDSAQQVARSVGFNLLHHLHDF